MSGDIFAWKMKQLLGNIQAEFSDLTETDLEDIENRQQLEWLIQEKYGLAKEEAGSKLDDFAKKYL